MQVSVLTQKEQEVTVEAMISTSDGGAALQDVLEQAGTSTAGVESVREHVRLPGKAAAVGSDDVSGLSAVSSQDSIMTEGIKAVFV